MNVQARVKALYHNFWVRAIAIILFVACVWPTPYRYMSGSPATRINRFTGTVEVWWDDGWGPAHEPFKSRTGR